MIFLMPLPGVFIAITRLPSLIDYLTRGDDFMASDSCTGGSEVTTSFGGARGRTLSYRFVTGLCKIKENKRSVITC